MVAVATLVATIYLYIIVPKGFFPVQDTGVILGITEAAQDISFPAMADRQEALAKVILADPAVESLSSFIGVDGTNTTPNSGRLQINLKPLEVRRISASDVIRRLQPKLATVEGVTLFMQPVQDLTVEDRVSRTQFQYSLEDPDPKELATWVPRFVDKLKTLPMLRDVASDQQNQGLQVRLLIDRDTASRLGISAQNIDDALYNAFGQRQISTIYTQLNQYHVVLDVMPGFQKVPEDLTHIFVEIAGRDGRPARHVHDAGKGKRPAGDQPPGPVSRRHGVVQSGPGCLARRRGDGDQSRPRPNWECPRVLRPRSREPPRRFALRSPMSRC